jgi:hypothetical protein
MDVGENTLNPSNYRFELIQDSVFEKHHKSWSILKVVKASEDGIHGATNHFGLWGIQEFGFPEGGEGC